MIYKLQTPATTEPVSLESARIQIGLDSADTSSDMLLTALIAAAREFVKNYTNRSLISETWIAYMDSFDTWKIEIAKVPVTKITSIKYYDSDNEQQTIDASDYMADIQGEPARIFPAEDYSWPDTYDRPNAVEIAFTAGYGSSANDVPDPLKAAILMIIAHLEANRGDEGFRTLPRVIYDLLNDYKIDVL